MNPTMEQSATTLSATAAEALIEACAEQIRAFLHFVREPEAGSSFAQVPDWQVKLAEIPESIRAEATLAGQKEEAFSTEALVSYGEFYEEAVRHPVRIEVRRSQSGQVTQIAARGVIGAFRKPVLEAMRKTPGLETAQVEVRISGQGSFEVNRIGVNKALPIRYLTYKWEEIMAIMDYRPGYHIDARSSKTLIAADGDGTTYGMPTLEGAPTLKESETYAALTAYLESGGIYMLLSGNKLDRTAARIGEGLPPALKRRVILVADGGALMAVFDAHGRLKEVDHYVETGRSALEWPQKRQFLDMIYLGDDGRKEGNDLDAFREVGWDRSILVADLKTDDIIPSLQHKQVGGHTRGTRALLDKINSLLTRREPAPRSFFTQDCIDSLVKYARET